MSSFHLLLSRSNQLLCSRLAIINRAQISSLFKRQYPKQSYLSTGYKDARFMQTSAPPPPPPPGQSPTPPPPKDEEPKSGKEYKDQIVYTVKFKERNIKKLFKEFYSFYGPLFVVCHIGVSLTSLGFFCTLVTLTVNPMDYVPDSIIRQLVYYVNPQVTEAGGKFMLAYAVHKVLLPLRLGGTILLTRFLAPKVRLKWKSKTTTTPAEGSGGGGGGKSEKTTGKE